MSALRLSLLAWLAALASAAQAARPMITDDARLTDAGACQVESWAHVHRSEREFWVLPACNPFGNLELTAGGALAYADGQRQGSGRVVQLKTLLQPLSSNGYGIGLAAGYAAPPGAAHAAAPYVYVPLSVSLADDRLVVHANLGHTRQREQPRKHLTWGLGGEWQATPRLFAIAESYGQERGSPFFQAGLRYWLVPERVQIDTTWGSRLGHVHEQRWLSLGLRLISPRLFD